MLSILNMTTKANFIPELQDLDGVTDSQENDNQDWKVTLDFDSIETSQLTLIERARLFIKLSQSP